MIFILRHLASVDPDPHSFHADPDPDPDPQKYADPCGSRIRIRIRILNTAYKVSLFLQMEKEPDSLLKFEPGLEI